MTCRLIVAHVHLFKNAGTSIEASLRETFGKAWTSFDGATSASRLTQADLEDLLNEHPSLRAVSSHQLRPPLVPSETYRYLPVVMLRHPIDRLHSAYQFERQQGPVSPSAKAAATSPLADWIDFHDSRSSSQCANFQTISLTSIRGDNGAPLMRRPIEEHIESATGFLDHLGAVGIVERFDESIDAIAAWLRTEIKDFAWSGQHLNSGPPQAASLEERLARVERELGPDRYAQLVERNQADLALHATYRDRLGG